MFWRRKKESKRKFERVRQTLQLPMPWLSCRDENGISINGDIIDISEGGLCLRVPSPIQTGHSYIFVFKDKEIKTLVRWCRFNKQENFYYCGLEILDSDAKLLDEIMKVWSIGD